MSTKEQRTGNRHQRQREADDARRQLEAEAAANGRLVRRVLWAKLATAVAVPFIAWGSGQLSGRPSTLAACIEGSLGLWALLAAGAVCLWHFHGWSAKTQ